ncbi:hypothetical protein ACHAXR_003481, partial [Thalassiosira sp. AJA248-18]
VLLKAASKVGIEMSCLTLQEFEDQKVRLDQLFSNKTDGVIWSEDSKNDNIVDEDDTSGYISMQRKRRKEDKRARKMWQNLRKLMCNQMNLAKSRGVGY